MKLSIITINYNNFEGLRKTINSVVAQTWRDFEWIVVDGGSTDGSRELIEEYALKGCFAWWCSEPDKGIYNAMNKGIKQAQGEYLNFLNSGDCYYSDNSLKKMFSMDLSADIIYGRCAFGTRKEHYVPVLPKKIKLSFLYKKSICHPSSFIKRSLLESVPYDETYKIVSDWKNWLLWFVDGHSFEYVDEIISLFDISGVSSTNGEIVRAESNRALREVLPNYVYDLVQDYTILEDQKEQVFSNGSELEQTYKYISTRRLYKRIIKINLAFINWLDNIFPHPPKKNNN